MLYRHKAEHIRRNELILKHDPVLSVILVGTAAVDHIRNKPAMDVGEFEPPYRIDLQAICPNEGVRPLRMFEPL